MPFLFSHLCIAKAAGILVGYLIACCARIRVTHRQDTQTQDNCCNPHCICTLSVNYVTMRREGSSFASSGLAGTYHSTHDVYVHVYYVVCSYMYIIWKLQLIMRSYPLSYMYTN